MRCACDHCRAIGRYLASPSNESWVLKAAEQVRRHVEEEIKARAHLDLEKDVSSAALLVGDAEVAKL
jgi:hypothetical protein